MRGYITDDQLRAGEAIYGNNIANFHEVSGEEEWEKKPYTVTAAAVLSITVNSDIVSLYIDPSLGYSDTYEGKIFDYNSNTKVLHKLAWGAYAELYITPIKDLEWYFEMDVNNNSSYPTHYNGVNVTFNTTTGITWYLPTLDQ